MSRDEEDESGIDWRAVALAGFGAIGGALGGIAVRRGLKRWQRGGANSHMADRIISEARRLCTPTPPRDYVGPGDPRWDDELLGGQHSAGVWQWYEDGYGTSCAVVATSILERAGVSLWTSPLTGASGRLLLNRPEPAGVGYLPGAWAERFVSGGDRCGNRIADADLMPGDLYYIQRGDPKNWHVGIVLERSGQSVLTADGGQKGPATPTAPDGCQAARITSRTLRGRMLSSSIAAPGEIKWRLTWPT